MRIGIRAHDYGKLTVEALAQKTADSGLSSVQLALAKAIEGFDAETNINTGLAWHIGQTFLKKNVQIAVLGCYINPIDRDVNSRNKQLDRFCEHIRFARDMGASLIGTETGIKTDVDDFDILVSSVARLVEEAEKFGVFVGIEGVHCTTIESPQRMKQLIDIIASNNLQVIFDPVNFINYENYKYQQNIMYDSFNLFGDRIQVIHAKDFIVEDNCVKKAQIGKGMLDYSLLKEYIKDKKPYINVIMDEVDVAHVEENKEFLLRD